MPIGAIIGGVASVGGALIGSSAQKKAARRAEQAAQRTADQNNALARDIYGQNQQALAPFQQRGNAAGDAINSLLGLGVAQQPQQQSDTYQPNALMRFAGGSPYNMEAMGGDAPGVVSGYGGGTFNAGGQPIQSNPLADYNQAFGNYKNSTGYQFRFNEGMRALDAAAPVLNSGKRFKDLQNYGQNITSGEFGNYLNALFNQQGVGLSGASAQAGVGQNYVNTVSANNNSAGSAAANAALMRGQANANMWGGIAGGLGSIFGSSFGR